MRVSLAASLALLAAVSSAKTVAEPRIVFAHSSSPLLESISPFAGAAFTGHRAGPQPAAAGIGDGCQTTSGNVGLSGLVLPPKEECPPCNPFNCVLPSFPCLNKGECNDYNGQCICPPGFGGEDCSKPLCGALSDGDQRFPRDGDSCECQPGWGGLNCNVCETDQACAALKIRDPTTGLLKDSDDDEDHICYKEGLAVREMYQMCDVTNRKILDMLPDRPPQVTFTCDKPSATCGFQFWIGAVESFYCGLSDCSSSIVLTYDSNYTQYDCPTMECSCIPGKMLCGENGSVDISEFLTEEIKGPVKFSTRTGEGSKFEEPAMNQLINDIFGDTFITLDCHAGECMRASEAPGFVRPPKPNDRRWVVASVAIVGAVIVLGLLAFWFLGRAASGVKYSLLGGRIRLPSDDDGPTSKSLTDDHIPAALQFADLTYTLPSGKVVLDRITGEVNPGEVMAVIGASGAGKSTLLDLLARKAKHGLVSGDVLVNGQKVPDAEFRRVVGFVDQEDTLMGTLTVYETVLYSALLRLPREMSFADKKMRTLETMHELGILHIRDSRIGESGQRSISGGEKRRVSIACELVTSPSILFLDEPTSGLDSFNAFNVVESLVQLAKTYRRTVVFTIHQPRSNIVALFDKLLLLASGKTIYSGPAEPCQSYFATQGYPCPGGFNIADYLIDLTAQTEQSGANAAEAEAALIQLAGEQDAVPIDDPELGDGRHRAFPSAEETELDTRPNSAVENGTAFASAKRFFSGSASPSTTPISARLASLAEAYARSEVAQATRDAIAVARAANVSAGEGERTVLRNYKRASWIGQLGILSGRSFRNLYRNPMLMLSHYAVAVVVAGVCAFLFRGLTEDIPGFQNRMGLFFFALAIFGFGCLATISTFATERLLFMRERANGYYSPATWFAAKLLFDIVPLRVIPPFVFGAIVYAPVGLVPAVGSFWRFILVLVLFNLTASSVVLFLSVLIRNPGVANLAGSLVMLFNLLFAGLLINREKLPDALQWLETGSFFHAAFEALLVNEVRYLQLKDHRYGIDIEVPAAAILSTFGFKAQAFWWPDVALLVALFAGFTAASFGALVLLVKERR